VDSQIDKSRDLPEPAPEAFFTTGFEDASLRRIADGAGVMHQLVACHFKTKDALEYRC
jgi:hypothetical protein